jgi:uncharacterized membrane-anchored protein YitT (DUF2179 family)
MVPSHVAVGSGSALAMVLSNFIPLPISSLLMIINSLLLIIGFVLIGPEFGAKTVYAALMVPAFMGLLEILFPNFESFTNDPLLDVLCYVLVVGIGMAILFSRNASSGGLDIVAKIMNKYLRMDLGKASSVAGIAIALSSALVYDTKTVVLSVLGTYFGGIVLDKFIFGMGLKKKVCIISPKLDLFKEYILNELHSGATIYESYGAYDNVSRKEIVTIVDKSEFRRLMDFIKKTDPKAFVTVYAVNEMQYQPKIWK